MPYLPPQPVSCKYGAPMGRRNSIIDPDDTPYTVTFHGMGGVVTGSRMWFYEQYA